MVHNGYDTSPGIDAAVAQTVSVRMRADLRVQQIRFQGRGSWIVKDPVSLRYFQLTEEEHTVLRMLDGDTSLTEIKDEFERRYAPQVVTYEGLQSLLHLFHQRGLVYADAIGQGAQLLERRRVRARRLLISKLTGLLFIRLPGVDPERFLNWLYPKIRWMYSRWFVVTGMLLVFSAIALVTIQFNAFCAMLPTFHQFFTARNVFWMMMALAIAKILHELGHALTCKHFGGECHEIGMAFLVFTPCLYCDTSDTWMLSNRWHRALVGVAGMWVEIILASACTFVWWFSQPGIVHYLCLSTIFICSVSTVVLNGNPFLRYDGYYVLSDLLEIPNLWQRSRAALTRVFVLQVDGERAIVAVLQVRTAIANDIAADLVGIHQLRFVIHGQ